MIQFAEILLAVSLGRDTTKISINLLDWLEDFSYALVARVIAAYGTTNQPQLEEMEEPPAP